MKRMLLIVDPQIDFIEGTLPVPGAAEAMDALARYIEANDGRYACKVVTADRHPWDHFSFKEQGGPWPMHCVHDTQGAAIWPALMRPLYTTAGDVIMLYKGERPDKEEYSIFSNPEAAERIRAIVEKEGIERIDLCGLAGDVCVHDTLRDGRALLGADMFEVLLPYSPSLDGGKRLAAALTS